MPERKKLPTRRMGNTFHFSVSGCEGYVTTGEYEDGRLAEIFIRIAKQGSTLSGLADGVSIAVSLGLQHGVPLTTYVAKFMSMKFEPDGTTDDPELKETTSLLDYIFRRLALDYLTVEERTNLGIQTTAELAPA